MFQRLFGLTLIAIGMLSMLLGASSIPASAATPTLMQPMPSPRPTLMPTPGAAPRTKPVHHDQHEAAVEPGHITGTVIDLRTGAPAAGVVVNVGGELVTTDANGNYDRWLPPGAHTVALALTAAQGTPAQGALLLQVAPAARVVQHLSFTSVQDDAPVAVQSDAAIPSRLPVTGALDTASEWLWLPFGAALLLFGTLLLSRPYRGRIGRTATERNTWYDNRAVLGHLLSDAPPKQPATPTSKDDDLLAQLLRDGPR